MCQLILVMHSDIVCIAKPHCKINFKSNHDDDDYLHLVHPHLPESEAHALLHIRPQLVLLLQHVARQQGRRRHRVVLLKIWSNYFTENATKWCWNFGEIMHFIPENCQLQTILYILRVAPATFEWHPFCPWQTLKRIKMWRDLHIPSLWILLQTHRDPFVLNNLVNGQPLLWVGLQAALARNVCQTLQEHSWL